MYPINFLDFKNEILLDRRILVLLNEGGKHGSVGEIASGWSDIYDQN